MKNKLFLYFILFAVSLTTGCSKQQKESEKNESGLKRSNIELNNLDSFEKSSEDWIVAENVSIDPTKHNIFLSKKGKGVLTNINTSNKNENLISQLQHGNIELEFDVMLSKGIESGIYFQGKYKVLLTDSWSKNNAAIKNIGSVDTENIASENMAKAPGLWQHVKIVFYAPEFNASGEKIKNARFDEITINGRVVIQNVEVLEPTAGAISKEEAVLGPLMIQGTEKTIAFNNISYKLNKFSSLNPENIIAEIKKSPKKIENLATIQELETISKKDTKTISPLTDLEKNAENLIVYNGTFDIPESADYLFTMFVSGGGFVSIGEQNIFNFMMSSSGHENTLPAPEIAKVTLKKGKTPFTIAYNKNSPRNREFELYVEGEHMERYSLAFHQMSKKEKEIQDMRFILLEPKSDRAILQRSFLMHEDYKRSHGVSVGFPQKTNYSYDLAIGSLLQIWSGGFINATHMWHERGAGQLAFPEGAIIPFHGDVDFAYLQNEKSVWPTVIPEDIELEQKGYEFDKLKNPTFIREINGDKIANKFTPSDSERNLTREITTDSKDGIWHKITEADTIEILSDGTYLILDQNIFIDFSGNGDIKPMIRSKGTIKELIVKIPSGKQKVNYDIIW